MNKIALAILLLVAFCTTAQAICAPRDVTVKTLLDGYKEVPIGSGFTGGNHQIVELFVSPTGTYTIFVTDIKTGLSCLRLAGREWKAIIPGQNL